MIRVSDIRPGHGEIERDGEMSRERVKGGGAGAKGRIAGGGKKEAGQ